MRELIECGKSGTSRRSNPHGAYSDGKFCNRALLQYLSQLNTNNSDFLEIWGSGRAKP